ncbi:MAG: efflux RND transporter periplasmic adaptor subunit, partial [Candidatus Caenarcaniphilales bacterium]|nr:efflux RND transporter periplasmic adaptor subunit [Candidatus Caenarcaniphilales bacterium]
PDQVLFSVADLSEVQVKVKVSQDNLTFVKKEQPITLTIRAYPGQKFKGKVSAIAIASEDPKQADPSITKDVSQKRWNVTMTVDNRENQLKPGMTGYAYIDSTQRLRIWQRIARELYRVFPLERFAVFKDSFFKATF